MKRFALTFVVMITFFQCYSQTKAVTDKGREVVLYEDGTYKYTDEKTSWETRLDTVICKRPASSTFLLKGNKTPYGVYTNPKKWHFKKADEAEDHAYEYFFTLIGEDAYGELITEGTYIPINEIKEIAYENAIKKSPDLKKIKEDVRNINGTIVHCMQMEGTISGMKIVLLGYYYSSEKMTIQFLSWSAKNQFSKYQSELENLLNGFVAF
ncbi:MAG: hypothetical protein WCL14_05630 [Bacteroidota bacterium]